MNPNSKDPGDVTNHTTILTGGRGTDEPMITHITGQDGNLIVTFDDGSIQSHNVASGVSTPLWPPAGDHEDGVAAVDLGFAAVVQDADNRVHVVHHRDDGSISSERVVFEDDHRLQANSVLASHQQADQVIAILDGGQIVALTIRSPGEPVIITTIGSPPSASDDYPQAAAPITIG